MENKPIVPNPPPNDPILVERIDNAQSNPASGFVGALLGAIIGAVLWGAIVNFTGYQIGFIAVGIGYLVGLGALRLGGNGSMTLGIIAGVCAFGGTLLGDFLATVMILGNQLNISPLDVISGGGFSTAISVFTRGFQFIDLLFYALAVFTAFRLASQQRTVVNRVKTNL